MHTRPFCIVNFERLCRVFPRDPQLRIESALFEWHDANLDVPSGRTGHPADGGGGTHARQPIRWRVLGGPCAWVARRCPPPPARRSPPPHLALGTSASHRHLHSSSCAQCMHTGGPCTWVARRCPPPPARRSLVPSSLSTTSRAPRGQLLLLAVPSSCSSLPSAVPRAATDRADHAASVPPAALRTQSTRRADEPPEG